MKVLVTGATGFVGGAVTRALAGAGHEVVAAVRRADCALPAAVCPVRVGELGPHTDWTEALAGARTVVHLAARAHVLNDPEPDPLATFRRVNRDGTVRLAEEAAAAGVKRLVFVSTIKVNGESTAAGKPFRAEDPRSPKDAYAVAKAEAEAALIDIAWRTGMELTIIRPPLVHGPRARGNLATLMRTIARGVPLPIGLIDNQRSLVGVDNLADLVRVCLDHPAAAGRTFLVRDDDDVSTRDLVRRLAGAMGCRARLLPVPPVLLGLGLRLAGKGAVAERLLGSLTVDDAPTRAALGWSPRLGLDEGLSAMAAAWRTQGGA
jgi:nucleoside-diphosphate-sugar epimerase